MSIERSKYVPAAESETGESYSIHTSEFIGQTVEITSYYMGDGDSSYSAVCWDQGKGEFVKVGGGYDARGMRVDAPEALMEVYRGLQAAEKAMRNARQTMRTWQASRDEEAREASTIRKGKVVEVVKGRKVAKGTIGTVVWYGEGQYGWRVGLKVPGQAETVWTASDNVEVVPAGRLGRAA